MSWFVKPQWASILEGNPDVDEVLPVDVSWQNWPRLIRDLRQRQFDLVIDFQGLFRTGLLGLFSGARMRVGFARAREGAPCLAVLQEVVSSLFPIKLTAHFLPLPNKASSKSCVVHFFLKQFPTCI